MMETLMDAQGGSFETHKAEGEKLYRQGEYKKSLESFSTVSSGIESACCSMRVGLDKTAVSRA